MYIRIIKIKSATVICLSQALPNLLHQPQIHDLDDLHACSEYSVLVREYTKPFPFFHYLKKYRNLGHCVDFAEFI